MKVFLKPALKNLKPLPKLFNLFVDNKMLLVSVLTPSYTHLTVSLPEFSGGVL